MVTGDNILTAKHIARQCKILTDDGIALEGPQFANMPDEEVLKILPKIQVLARSAPSDKTRLVKLLRHMHELVAVTGDGTNDGPALKVCLYLSYVLASSLKLILLSLSLSLSLSLQSRPPISVVLWVVERKLPSKPRISSSWTTTFSRSSVRSCGVVRSLIIFASFCSSSSRSMLYVSISLSLSLSLSLSHSLARQPVPECMSLTHKHVAPLFCRALWRLLSFAPRCISALHCMRSNFCG